MTEMTRHMVRMLLLAFCGMMSVLDVFGTSFAKNDLCYIENDAEELPPNKKHLFLILNVVDDVTKVQIGADTLLRGLEECPLEDVRINQCPVRDLDCLCAMPRLKFLDVCDTGVMSASRDELKKKFPNLEHFECSKADMSVQYEDW